VAPGNRDGRDDEIALLLPDEIISLHNEVSGAPLLIRRRTAKSVYESER